MISVQSRRLLLSGNKCLFIVLLAILFNACSTTESLPRRKKGKAKQRTHTKVKIQPKVDTVQWTVVDEEEHPPISDGSNRGLDLLDEYVIDVLFPFDLNEVRKEDLTDVENRYINYYAGMLMAIDILDNQGKKLTINMNDIGDRKRDIKRSMSSLVSSKSNVIVAPFHKDQVKAVADYGKRKKIPVVSPWLVSSTVTKDNPYYIKLMPDITEYYFAIMEDIAKRFSKEQVVLVGDASDRNKLDYLQELALTLFDEVTEEEGIEEYIVEMDSLANGVAAFDNIFDRQDTLVVVVPNYSGSDESYIYGCVRRLSVEKGETPVVIYGMPIMLNSERMEYDYFNSLNMCVARSKFVDKYNERVKAFEQDYLARFGSIATEDAYEGYDMMMYLGESLWKYGREFQYHLDQRSDYYLQSAFNIQKKHPKTAIASEKFDEIDYFVNKQVDIIRFKENKFSR